MLGTQSRSFGPGRDAGEFVHGAQLRRTADCGSRDVCMAVLHQSRPCGRSSAIAVGAKPSPAQVLRPAIFCAGEPARCARPLCDAAALGPRALCWPTLSRGLERSAAQCGVHFACAWARRPLRQWRCVSRAAARVLCLLRSESPCVHRAARRQRCRPWAPARCQCLRRRGAGWDRRGPTGDGREDAPAPRPLRWEHLRCDADRWHLGWCP